MSSIPTPPFSPTLSCRIQNLSGSVARDILSRSQDRQIVSFAGGLPDPELWQHLELPKIPASALQYGPSEGERPLRERFAAHVGALGLDLPYQRILITSGSQQGLDLISKLFLDPGSVAGVEAPTYLAALQCFRLFEARLRSLRIDSAGIDINALEQLLARERPVLLYVNPTFQNPTGTCYPLERRREIAELLDRYECVLVEDDPYREIYFGEIPPPPPIATFLRRASFVYLGSASKTLLPGLRVGFLAASEDLFPHLLKLKQAADLHTNRAAQSTVNDLMSDSSYGGHLQRIRRRYHQKRDLMQRTLRKRFGEIARWQRPEGGMFFWLALHEDVDLSVCLKMALQQGIAFMPGAPFFAESANARRPCLRLNFTAPSDSDIELRLPLLAPLLKRIATEGSSLTGQVS